MPTRLIKNLQLFRIAAFLVLLALPATDYFFDLGVLPSRNENRVLAALPGWSWDVEFLSEAPELYEAYVNDHLGIRFRRATPEAAPVEFHHYPPNLSLTFYAGTKETTKRFTTNSAGIRGPEFRPESGYRILCIGGSTTQNHYLDDSDTWTHLLMADLNRKLKEDSAWVGAIGIPGFTATQHLQYLRTNPALRQYTHVVFVLGVNDLLFWLSYKPAAAQPGQPVVQAARSRSGTGQQGVPPALEDRYNPIYNTMDAWQEFLEQARRSRAEATIVDEYPTPVRVLRNYGVLVGEIIDRCRELNIEPIFVTHPVLWAKDMPREIEGRLWLGRTRTDGEFLSASSLRELMDNYNEALTETCRERGAILVDASFMSGSAEAFVDDCHFSEYGAQLLAQRIADTILDSPKDAHPVADPALE